MRGPLAALDGGDREPHISAISVLPVQEFPDPGPDRLAVIGVHEGAGHPDGIAYSLEHGATLGRGDVEIRLEDPFASTRHARIERQGSVLVVEDLGSTNGTLLNEEPLTGPQPLHHGDRIRIGDSELTYLQD